MLCQIVVGPQFKISCLNVASLLGRRALENQQKNTGFKPDILDFFKKLKIRKNKKNIF